MVNGKTPIVRCDDVEEVPERRRHRQGRRARGSPIRAAATNVSRRRNFKTATLTIHAENLTIFDEILAKRADVFVTEAAEALTQQKLKPGLCAVNPDKPLQYGEMA
jgi:cyclohexadienyl dehydratase